MKRGLLLVGCVLRIRVNLLKLAYAELGAAAVIDPEAAAVDVPGLALDAGGAADLAGELDAAAGVNVTVVALAIVGGAGDDLSLAVAAGLKRGTGRGGERHGIGDGT